MELWELLTFLNTVCFWVPIIFRSWWAWKVKRASRNSGSDQSNSDDSRDLERNLRQVITAKTRFNPEGIETDQDGSK